MIFRGESPNITFEDESAPFTVVETGVPYVSDIVTLRAWSPRPHLLDVKVLNFARAAHFLSASLTNHSISR
jgi:hypothetical protein